jgi:uncharacterized membrane protein
MSELALVTGVFFNSSKTFADLGRRPRWFVPLLLVVLATVAYLYAVSQHVGWERVVRRSMETNARVQSLSAEQREQAVEHKVGKVKVGKALTPGTLQARIGH